MSAVPRAETILGFPVKTGRWNEMKIIKPEQSKQLLEAMPQQRPVVASHVDSLQIELKEHRWTLTHEGIAFDENGHLFDGQHRLWACFMSGHDLPVRCFFNEPRANFDNIGTLVRRRNFADHLAIGGVVAEMSLGHTIAGAARFIWAYDSGTNPTTASVQKGWHPSVMRDVLAAHPGVVAMADYLKARRKLPLPLMPFVALATLMEEADQERAAAFLHQVTGGESIAAGDPAYTLRESALARLATPRGFRTDMSYRIARAWNAFYEGRKTFRLYGSNAPGVGQNIRRGGMDPFPRISGHGVKASRKQSSLPKLSMASRAAVGPSVGVSP